MMLQIKNTVDNKTCHMANIVSDSIKVVTAQYPVAIRKRLKATVTIQTARIQIQRKNHKGCKF
ncbi:hypothetical protein KKG56_04135 [bacterium]|nr:hypothetical protein [bacterium]